MTKFFTACELARLSNIGPLTFATHQKRGVIPRPDVMGGRVPMYSADLGQKILDWYTREYKPYTRYGTWDEITSKEVE